GGNGLVQGSTFLAIIFGTILGNELILTEQGVTLVSIVVVGVAIAGFIASLYTPSAKPVDPATVTRRPVDWVFPRAIWMLIRLVAKNRPAFRTIMAISWFWFLGATFLSLLPAYAKEVLGGDESVLTVLLAGFSIGVAIGALLSEWACRDRGALDVAPYAALGLAVLAIELYAATPLAPPPELVDRATFFSDLTGWRILADFVLLAACAGLYVTPLNAALQKEAEEARRAQYIAASNVIDASFMVVSAAVVGVLVSLSIGTAEVLVVITLTALPVAIVLARFAPGTRLGRIALMLWPRGPIG
ncbi:MAG: MFS transporter, partial [Pseudomonadota bacterium]